MIAFFHQAGRLRGKSLLKPAIDLEKGMHRLNHEIRRKAVARAIAAIVLICGSASRGWCGNLWLADHYESRAASFTSTQLSKSGSPTPGGIVDIAATGLAFDKSKNLWIVVSFDRVEEFSAAQLKKLSSDDTPTPV